MELKQRDPNELYPHDKLMAMIVLPFIPKKIHPNHFTVLRFLLTPFAIWGLAIGAYNWSIPFFLFVGFTDIIDGSLARVRNKVTEWGTVYDPIADKVLVSLATVVVVADAIGWWLAIPLIFFELAIAMGGARKRYDGKIVTANYWGKTKMATQMLGITLVLCSLAASLPVLATVGTYVLLASIVLAIMSLITYSL